MNVVAAAQEGTPAASATMRAAIVTAPGVVEVQAVAAPRPQPNEVLVRLEGCGVCASNVPPWEGREWFSYPLEPGRLGHEGWGSIVEVGAHVDGWQVGERVGFLSNHAYAQFDVAVPGGMVRIPPELTGRPFPAEPLGCAVNIFRRSGIEEGHTVAVVGLGFLGLLQVQLAASAGARVIAIGRKDGALELARDFGAAETVAMDDHARVIDAVKGLTQERFCDVVVECTGKQWPLDLSGELVGVRGRLVVAGYHQDGLRQVNMQLWNWRGIDVVNAHERDMERYLEGMEEAARLVAAGTMQPERLFTHRFPLERLGEALDHTRDRPDGFMKALITFD